ncbi:(2Fe-2S)-binding protein [Brevibacillus sp. SYSU BS000544]|uniref:(2Fe-2S)-binding protein n=1 Tax=Brevibacillus sp. SYSU BS000544 TaxID=3416443 RepID=UPI003CE45FED
MDQNNMIICRCEEVTLGELLKTASSYQCTARELKLRTRAGMGYCGGRTCRTQLQSILEKTTGNPPDHTVPLAYQPPVRPVSFGLFGGQK